MSLLERVTYSDLSDLHRSIVLPEVDWYLDPGLGILGLLLLDRPENFGYLQTPINSIAFSHFGVDGIHLSCLTEKDALDPDAPVVLTIPNAVLIDMPPNYVVGGNLYEFLCLGYMHGYDDLCNIHLDYDTTVNRFSQPPRISAEQTVPEEVRKFAVNCHQLMREKFRLKPIPDVRDHLRDLRNKHHDQVLVREHYE